LSKRRRSVEGKAANAKEMEMKRYTLALITGACLVGVSAMADNQDKDVNKGAPPGQDRTDTGADTSTTIGKIKQGAKNIFTEM
jgi:hypothetical protein